MEQAFFIRHDLFDIMKNVYFNHDEETVNNAITKGDAQAFLYKALSCFYGVNRSQNYEEAYAWATKAAEKNNPTAQCLLGVCRAIGLGKSQDSSVMFYWFHKAAENNHLAGLFYLAQCYEKGFGISKNLQTALSFYSEAARLGDEISSHEAKILTSLLEAEAKEPSPEDIEMWFEAGEEYYYGENGKVQDYAEAVKWYFKAAEAGDADAQFSLGYCFLSGHGVDEDDVAACRWLEQAANQKHPDAIYNLGLCYEQGTGVPMNIGKALELYSEAVQLGAEGADETLLQLRETIAAYKAYFEEQGNRIVL